MADRIPLIVNSTANQIQELPTDDNLQLNDTNKLILGTQGELEIFHDANGVSRIIHTPPSSGNDLRLQIGAINGNYSGTPSGAQFHIEKKITAGGNGHNFITCDYDSNETRIQFADSQTGSTKLTTISTGCTITGDIHTSGKIVPSIGSGTGNGIRWPENPGGGSGDAASITYFVSDAGTEKTTLKIAVANDGSSTNVDNIELSTANDSHTTVSATGDASSSTTGAFRVSGGVGIGKKLFVGTEFKIGSATGSTAVDIIRDEDDMASNDPNALATQQSIKKYVDDTANNTGNALSLTADDNGATTINLGTETLDIEGTANEIVTATGTGIDPNKLRVGLTNDVTIGRDLTVTRNLTAAKINVDDIELDGSKIVLDNNPSTQGELEISYEGSSGTSRITHIPPTGGDDLRLQIGAINGNYSGTPSGTQLILEKKVTATGNGHNFITCDYDSNETRICYANSSTGSTKLTTKSTGVDITGILNVSGKINANNTSNSSSKSSGSLIVDGGVGIQLNLYVGEKLNVGDTFRFGSGQAVNSILNQNTLSSNSSSALATQSSIKAYADNLSSVSGNFTVNGTLTANRIDVDNIRLDLNKITTTSGDLTLDATGTNDVIVNSDKLIVNNVLETLGDTNLGNGTGDDTTISGILRVQHGDNATALNDGALRVTGGMSCTKRLVVGEGGIRFKGTGTSGDSVEFNPQGAAPVIGVRAYGFITAKTSNGTYNTDINGVNIASYERVTSGNAPTGGTYKVNFTLAMPHNNYVVMVTPVFIDKGNNFQTQTDGSNVLVRLNKTTTQCHVVPLEGIADHDAKDFSFHIAIIC